LANIQEPLKTMLSR